MLSNLRKVLALGLLCCWQPMLGVLNEAGLWRPMGSVPMTVTAGRAEGEIEFRMTKEAGRKSASMWPLVHASEGFPGMERLAFEMLLEPLEGTVQASIVLAGQKGISGSFPFKAPQPGSGWQAIDVDLRREGYVAGLSRTLQISVSSTAPAVVCRVRKIRALSATGQAIELPLKTDRWRTVTRLPVQAAEGEEAQYFVTPDVDTTLTFRSQAGAEQSFVICDFAGKEVHRGVTRAAGQERIALSWRFPVGFYEVRFGDGTCDQRFGVCSQPAFAGERDSFFALECLLDGRGEARSNALMTSLLAHGVGITREWYGYAGQARVREEFKERSTFYRRAAEKGMKAIFCFADFPAWYGLTSEKHGLPQQLLPLHEHILQLLSWRRPALNAFHVLNEYDLWRRPGWCNLPVIKTAGYAMSTEPSLAFASAPFCMGSGARRYVETSIRNGLLDYVDVFTFHTYAEPEKLQEITSGYRDMMKGHAKSAMPMWITESGRPWSRRLSEKQRAELKAAHGGPLGALHPEVDEDGESALWNAMKAVEAKACGIARIYPFTLPFFQENNNNFGLMDFWWTPLRSLTAYLRAVHELSGYEYVGDLALKLPGVVRARVFQKGDSLRAVLYFGSKSAMEEKSLSLQGLSVTGARTIDGRPLTLADSVTFGGGMLYLDLREAKLVRETQAMSLKRQAESYRQVARVSSPVIYQFKFWEHETSSFHVYLDKPQLTLRLHNLSNQEVEVLPEISLPSGAEIRSTTCRGRMKLAPRSEQEVTWEVDFSRVQRSFFMIAWRDKLLPHTSEIATFVNRQHTSEVRFGLNEARRWRHNANTVKPLSITYDEQEKAIRIDAEFDARKPGYWVFPEYVLSLPEENLGRAIALKFEMKFQQSGESQKVSSPLLMLASSQENEVAPYEASSYGTPTAEWQDMEAAIPAEHSDTYQMIRLGMCPQGSKVTYWLRNLRLVVVGETPKQAD